MRDEKEFLGTEPIGRLLLRLAVPTVMAQLINMLYNLVDRIYIGHISEVGDLALTGVGVCMPIIMLVSAFAALVSSGGAPRASIFMGKGKTEEAEKILGGCFSLQIIVSCILTVVLLMWGENILSVFGASENTIGYARDYISIYAMGTVFVQLTLGMNAFITAQGFSKISMICVAIGAFLNIALDPVFIYAFNMGVKGAAVATVISQGVSCIFAVSFLLSKKAILKIKRQNLFVSYKIILPCIALGTATFIMQASESVIFVCFNSSLLRYGGDIAVGAMTILGSVMQFAMLPLQGIAQGAQPILSYNYGAKNSPRVIGTFKILLTVCLAYSVLLWSSVMLFPRAFGAMFTADTELLDFTESVIRIYFAGMIIFGIQIACQMTFVSLGKAMASVSVAVVRKFLLLLPLIYITPSLCEDKSFGVYLAEPIADILAVTFTAILFGFIFKSAIGKIKSDTEAKNDILK